MNPDTQKAQEDQSKANKKADFTEAWGIQRDQWIHTVQTNQTNQ